MKKRNTRTAGNRIRTSDVVELLLVAVLTCSAPASSQGAGPASIPPNAVVARVNGVAIHESAVRDEVEVLYPSNSAHGGVRPEKLKEIRSKALEELIVQELAYQQAVKTQALAPMAEVRAELARLRQKYGAADFDRSLQTSGLTRQQYLKNLQRRMTLERLAERKLVRPSRLTLAALRAYFNQNTSKFQRPEQIQARLMTVNLAAGAKPEEARKAKEKIDGLYQQLRAGRDFGDLAEEFSEDYYRVKGGDLGWVHRGRLEPVFEKVAFSLQPGQISEPFQTEYGYSLMKVEGRAPARQMKFEEVRPVLKAELEQKKFEELRQAWVARLKKGAQIEIVAAPTAGAPETRAAH